MAKFVRSALLSLVVVALSFGVLAQTAAPAQPPAFEIHGVVKSGNTLLPGVTVSATQTLTGKKVFTSTDLDGSYRLLLPMKGRWVVRADMSAFAAQTHEVMIEPATPTGKADFALILLSRVPKSDQSSTAALQQMAATLANGTGTQQLSVNSDESTLSAFGDDSGNGGNGNTPLEGMPSLASSADATNESVAVTGQQGSTQDFGLNSMEDMRDRIQQMRANGRLMSGEGPGGGGPMGGGPMMMIGGGGPRALGKFNINRPHGAVYYTAGNSALNAAPYSLSGADNPKPGYGSNTFGGMIGGPLNIPHVYNGGMKTMFFGGYTGTRSSTPYDVFSHVPTLAERNGDFSQTVYTSGPNAGDPVQLYDPSNGSLLGSQLNPAMFSPAAQALLKYIPLPNQPGQQNYRFSSSSSSNNDRLFTHFVHNFGQPMMPGMFGRGGGRGGRNRNNINLGFNYSNSNSDLLRPFASASGTSHSRGFNLNGGWAYGRGRKFNMLRVTWNRNEADVANLYAGVNNIAGSLGINGASQNPSDWGLPGLSFSNFQGLSDIAPQHRIDQVLQFSDFAVFPIGKHNIHFGGDFRKMSTSLHNNSNPRGTFTFTGFATAARNGGVAVPGTGYDFADFLLGYAQQTTIQYSPYTYQFNSDGWDLFVMDDWRVRGNLTLQLGLRYEYIAPYTESDNRLVNLDVSPGFTAASAVQPGQTGPYYGAYPKSLVNPDRDNFAPRVGFAWKPFSKTVVRGGYGINYNLGQYRSIVQNLAFQPPFSFTETNAAASPTSLTFANGFPAPSPAVLTNNYGIDPNYHIAYVQMWDLDIQRELPGDLLLNLDYTGSKGTALDMVRAPNREPNGQLRIAGVQPFLWETSQGSSIMHAGSVSLRRRMHNGLSVGGTYKFSKSIDNASSIGGGATVVAQNDLNLAAERGLSSFDQRHNLTGYFNYELPFGTGKKWFSNASSFPSRVFGDWTLNGSFTLASGFPFTPRVIGDFATVANGTNGSLRADYNGQPISISNPTVQQWFNTAAFSVPAPGTYGTAGRNSIEGPGTVLLDMGITKEFPLRDMMNLEISANATNVLNHPNYAGINTTVNSPTFGQVISVGGMRQISMSARYRF